MVIYGWLWTNECCMCARSTHDEVGRFGRVGRRKADFGPVLSSPRGGFGGIWGVMDGPSRAKIGSGAREARAAGQVWGHNPTRVGGTSGPNWGHNRRAAGGFGGFRGFVSGQTRAAKFLRGGGLAALAWGHKPAWLGAYPCRTGGTTGRRVVGSVGVRKLFWPVASGKPPCCRPLRWGIPP